jgi:hypothetical protein
LPTVERRHKHHNTDQVVSGKSHRLCYHARSPSRPNLEAPNAPSSILSPRSMTTLLHLSSPSREAPDCPDSQPAHSMFEEYTSSPSQQLFGLYSRLPVANPLRIKQLLSLFAVAFALTRIVHRPSSYAPQVSSPEKTTTQTHTEDSALTTHGLDGDCFLIVHLYFGILSLQ